MEILFLPHLEFDGVISQLRESKGMTTIKFRPHSGEVIAQNLILCCYF